MYPVLSYSTVLNRMAQGCDCAQSVNPMKNEYLLYSWFCLCYFVCIIKIFSISQAGSILITIN